MYCNKCGAALPEGAVFCANCGNRIDVQTQADTMYSATQPAASAQPAMPVQAAAGLNDAEKAVKARKIVALVTAALACIAALSLVISLICSAASSDELVPALTYDSLLSTKGDYVTTDIRTITPVYERYMEKNGVKQYTTSYECFAINTNGEVVVCSVPATYYSSYLAQLEDNELSENSVTVYGDLVTVSSDFINALEEDYSDVIDVENIKTLNELKVLDSPRTESSNMESAIAFFAVMLIVMLILMVISFKKYKYANNKCNDYGDYVAIAKQTKANAVYKDAYISVSPDYIVSNYKDVNLVATADILNIYEYIHRTNFVVDKVSMIVINKYNERTEFSYDKKMKDKIPLIIATISPLCPNAVFGHTSQAAEHIAAHQQSRKK